MISDKDDQASSCSSCSGQLLGGRDHMRVGCKRTKPCFGAGTRNTSGKSKSATHNWAAGQMFFLSCCPWPLIGFQRRLVEIGKIAHLHLQPPPPSPICFSRQATTTSESCRRKESVSVCRWHVAVSQVKGEYPSRWPTRSGPFFNKRQSWSPPQQAVRRTRRAAMPVEAFAGD